MTSACVGDRPGRSVSARAPFDQEDSDVASIDVPVTIQICGRRAWSPLEQQEGEVAAVADLVPVEGLDQTRFPQRRGRPRLVDRPPVPVERHADQFDDRDAPIMPEGTNPTC